MLSLVCKLSVSVYTVGQPVYRACDETAGVSLALFYIIVNVDSMPSYGSTLIGYTRPGVCAWEALGHCLF